MGHRIDDGVIAWHIRRGALKDATTYVLQRDTSYGRIMPANSFAAIRPTRTPRRMCSALRTAAAGCVFTPHVQPQPATTSVMLYTII